MGYYTDYELTIEHGNLCPLEVRPALEKISEYEFYENGSALVLQEAKWYRHEEDMRLLSTEHPSVVFCLHGSGEDADGDMWYKYFCNGKSQTCRGKVVYPPYDPTALR